MNWRDKYKGKRREADPAMIDLQGRLKNSLVEFNQTNRNKTVVRADELEGVEVRQNRVTEGPQVPPSGRSLFHLGPGAKRVTIDGVNFKGSGIDSFVSGADAEHLFVTGCSIDPGEAPRAEPRRIIFLPPSAPSVTSLEQQRSSRKLIGRNEPCPCRSGKKYKRCHGALR